MKSVQIRTDREDLRAIVKAIDDGPSRAEVEAERAVLSALGGGCSTPIGARARFRDSFLHLDARVASPDGEVMIRVETHGPCLADRPDGAADLGRRAAELLNHRGARDLLSP